MWPCHKADIGIHSFPQRNEKCVLSQWPTEAAVAVAATTTSNNSNRQPTAATTTNSSNNNANNGAANAHKSKVNCFLANTYTHTHGYWVFATLRESWRARERRREREERGREVPSVLLLFPFCVVFECFVNPPTANDLRLLPLSPFLTQHPSPPSLHSLFWLLQSDNNNTQIVEMLYICLKCN